MRSESTEQAWALCSPAVASWSLLCSSHQAESFVTLTWHVEWTIHYDWGICLGEYVLFLFGGSLSKSQIFHSRLYTGFPKNLCRFDMRHAAMTRWDLTQFALWLAQCSGKTLSSSFCAWIFFSTGSVALFALRCHCVRKHCDLWAEEFFVEHGAVVQGPALHDGQHWSAILGAECIAYGWSLEVLNYVILYVYRWYHMMIS